MPSFQLPPLNPIPAKQTAPATSASVSTPSPAPSPLNLPTLLSPGDLFGPKVASGKALPTLPLETEAKATPQQKKHHSVGTGYYPHDSKLEGGFKDMLGKPLRTLQDFLAGKAPYVSIALDENMYEHIIVARRKKYLKTGQAKYKKYLTMEPQIRYGDTFRIPELEKKYGRKIIFKAVDTGGAFKNKGFGRVDIATGGYKHTLEKTINGPLTLIPDKS